LNTVMITLFTTITMILFFLVQSLFLSIISAVSILVAMFTYLISRARVLEAERIDAIMDIEDILCPLSRDGVLVAVKKLLESKEYIDVSIRHYFIQFVDNCENHGYSFSRAMGNFKSATRFKV
jgi:hypothetical protein